MDYDDPSRVLSITPFFHPSTKGQLVIAQWCPVAGWKLRCSMSWISWQAISHWCPRPQALRAWTQPMLSNLQRSIGTSANRAKLTKLSWGTEFIATKLTCLRWRDKVWSDPCWPTERIWEERWGIVQDPFSQKFSSKTFCGYHEALATPSTLP